MLHDVLIVIGIFAWLGKPIDGVFLAAALTIIGVSVNDSVVTMDRIRETWARHRSRPLREVANEAIIATAPRTINTGLGAFFILGALTVLGGRSLTDFALALLIGLFVGTYSSAFVAVAAGAAVRAAQQRAAADAQAQEHRRPRRAPGSLGQQAGAAARRHARAAREGGHVVARRRTGGRTRGRRLQHWSCSRQPPSCSSPSSGGPARQTAPGCRRCSSTWPSAWRSARRASASSSPTTSSPPTSGCSRWR